MDQRRLGAYGRFLWALPRYLKNPLTLEESGKNIRERLKNRKQSFLNVVESGIYSNPGSPYLRLLNMAGCEYDDFVEGIEKKGIEGFLGQLMQSGVWISEEEFKGRVPVERGSTRFSIDPDSFDNPGLSGIIPVSTGGSSGLSVKTRFDLDFLACRASYDRFMFRILNLE